MQIRGIVDSGLVRKDAGTHDELRYVRRERVEKWFGIRADAFIKSAAHGLFTRTIRADHLKAEFRAIARALGGEGEVLEDWFETRAEAFVQKTAKKTKLDIEEVRKEFKLVAREYSDLIRRLEEKAALRGRVIEPEEDDLQEFVVDDGSRG
jgi:hypothetical protein